MYVKLTGPRVLWLLLVAAQVVLGVLYFTMGMSLLLTLIPVLVVGTVVLLLAAVYLLDQLLG